MALTVRTKVCVAAGETPLAAVRVKLYVPCEPAAGVPASVAVPSPLFVKVTPLGSAPDSVSVAFGEPVVFTVNVLATFSAKAVAATVVIVGAVVTALTVKASVWVATGETPLLAVMVSE